MLPLSVKSWYYHRAPSSHVAILHTIATNDSNVLLPLSRLLECMLRTYTPTLQLSLFINGIAVAVVPVCCDSDCSH